MRVNPGGPIDQKAAGRYRDGTRLRITLFV
jgi:hypothetical protein